MGKRVNQTWYWTASWQRGERAVDRHVAAGDVEAAGSVDEFLAAMDKVRLPSSELNMRSGGVGR